MLKERMKIFLKEADYDKDFSSTFIKNFVIILFN
jgi:hypothetical protein